MIVYVFSLSALFRARRPVETVESRGASTILKATVAGTPCLAFPKQELNDDQFERFAACFGEFGEDPFFNPIEGHKYIAAMSSTS